VLTEWNAYKRVPLPVASAKGSDLWLQDGRRVLDLYGGHCVNTLGAGDPALGEVIARQWQRWSFATNLLDHAPRRDFQEAFAKNLPEGDWVVFCSNSGAEANENALKTALAATGRRRVACFTGAFHGRTAAAAAVSDTKKVAFPQAPFEVLRLPWGDLAEAQAQLDGRVGAVILEPIQSLAGVTIPPPGFLAGLRQRCDELGALLVFDEVQTGNGRLGTPWASQHYGVIPDLFTTAKGAAGGLPIGLTVARAAVAARCPDGLLGSTFGGGPTVLAAAAHVASRIASPGFLANVKAASASLQAAILGAADLGAGTPTKRNPVASIRGEGLLLGLVLREGESAAAVRDHWLSRGVLVGTSDDPRVLRLSPALTLEPASAARLASAIAESEAAA
jgi:acetylornithine/succinyldiaminopimelate/putrescine aminotransferase